MIFKEIKVEVLQLGINTDVIQPLQGFPNTPEILLHMGACLICKSGELDCFTISSEPQEVKKRKKQQYVDFDLHDYNIFLLF